ncbi:RlmE family RNA methyltransferase, partial [Acinetobacter baumannii]
RVGKNGSVLGVDINPMDPVPGATVIQLDFLSEGADRKVMDMLGGPVDVVLSDMASPATGHRQTDHIRIMALCEIAIDFAERVLKPGGHFAC